MRHFAWICWLNQISCIILTYYYYSITYQQKYANKPIDVYLVWCRKSFSEIYFQVNGIVKQNSIFFSYIVTYAFVYRICFSFFTFFWSENILLGENNCVTQTSYEYIFLFSFVAVAAICFACLCTSCETFIKIEIY